MGAIKHHGIDIPSGNPFTNCKLGRKEYADVLTQIVKANPNGFVLALDSEWGTGKTTFVRMWQQSLIDDGYQTLYINAWENDLIADPSVAILGELKKLINQKNKISFDKVMKAGTAIIKNILPALAKELAKQHPGIGAVTEIVEGAAKSSADLLYESVEEYTKKKEGIEEFKKQLEEYLSKGEFKLPVVFIIDELDRCRPDYAVEFLEKIKHFFSVEGIVFVLSLDKNQIKTSIKGFYGSDLIDSEEYLRRFIDIEYRLPQPDLKKYCDHLYDYFEFDQFFSDSDRQKCFINSDEGSVFINTAASLASKNKLTLRQIEKLFAHCRLALKSFEPQNIVVPHLFFLMVFLRNHRPEIYNKLQSKIYNYSDLVDELFSTVDAINVFSTTSYTIAYLLVSYAEYKLPNKDLYDTNTGLLTFPVKEIDQQSLVAAIKDIQDKHHYYDILNHLFKKIELYSDLVLNK